MFWAMMVIYARDLYSRWRRDYVVAPPGATTDARQQHFEVVMRATLWSRQFCFAVNSQEAQPPVETPLDIQPGSR